MSKLQITLLALAAVLLFWMVGAYNRLMRLRNAILRSFEPLARQLRQRHGLLRRQIDALATFPTVAGQDMPGLQAAADQAHAALNLAAARPGAADVLASLRLAESILRETRGRWPMPVEPGADLADLNAQISHVEAALQVDASRFNDAVMEYNLALRQFPTCLLAGWFGFREAGAF